MKKYINYANALTDNEILLYSKIIDRFKKEEINFLVLKSMFLDYGITIEPITTDISNQILTNTEFETINKRYTEQNYLYNDINYFILNSDKFKDIVFRIDYKAIEVLANNGEPEYQQILISILTEQLKNSYDADEDIQLKRNRWKRRINELQEELSKNDNFIKSK